MLWGIWNLSRRIWQDPEGPCEHKSQLCKSRIKSLGILRSQVPYLQSGDKAWPVTRNCCVDKWDNHVKILDKGHTDEGVSLLWLWAHYSISLIKQPLTPFSLASSNSQDLLQANHWFISVKSVRQKVAQGGLQPKKLQACESLNSLIPMQCVFPPLLSHPCLPFLRMLTPTDGLSVSPCWPPVSLACKLKFKHETLKLFSEILLFIMLVYFYLA